MGVVRKEIERRLTQKFQPTSLKITDDSAHHAGHAGHDPRGESHFTIEIESAAFEGLSRVARQRAVNQELHDLLETRIHALAIKASVSGE